MYRPASVTLPRTLVIASVLLFGVTLAAGWLLDDRNQELTSRLAVDVAGIRAAEDLVFSVREARAMLNRFLVTRDRRHLEAVPGLLTEAKAALKRAIESAEDEESPYESERKLLVALQPCLTEFAEEFAQARVLGGDETWHELSRLRDEFWMPLIVDPVYRHLERQQAAIGTTIEENNQFADQFKLALLGLGGLGAAAGIAIGFGMSWSVNRTIVQLSIPLHNTAGKLSQVIGPITVQSHRNFQDLESNLHRVADQVGAVVDRLQSTQRDTLRAEQLAAVGQMAAGFAHELRNPLTSMKILIQAADERGIVEPSDLAVFEQELSRLEGLISTFLEFARPPRIQKRSIDWREVVARTIELVRPRAQRTGTQLRLEMPEVPVLIHADDTQLHQLLLNLLLNALDAIGQQGSIWVRLEAWPPSHYGEGETAGAMIPRRDEIGGRSRETIWKLQIRDSGGGLPESLGDRIFDPFVSTKATGIGMGLSICRRIIEDHGGSISAANHSEGGAVFSIILPAGVAEPQELAATA